MLYEVITGVPAGDVPLARAAAVTLPFDELIIGQVPFGHISVAVDADGTIRRLPLLVRYEDRIYPALSLRLAGLVRHERTIESVTAARGGVLTRWTRGTTMFIPTDAEGATALDFAGDRTAFPHRYSMLEVLQWYRAGDTVRLREAFSRNNFV